MKRDCQRRQVMDPVIFQYVFAFFILWYLFYSCLMQKISFLAARHRELSEALSPWRQLLILIAIFQSLLKDNRNNVPGSHFHFNLSVSLSLSFSSVPLLTRKNVKCFINVTVWTRKTPIIRRQEYAGYNLKMAGHFRNNL